MTELEWLWPLSISEEGLRVEVWQGEGGDGSMCRPWQAASMSPADPGVLCGRERAPTGRLAPPTRKDIQQLRSMTDALRFKASPGPPSTPL
jgi:hypothetical protein